ncbi:MAG: hypothetical protein WBF81_03185 [Thermoplasmata archaeon]
MNERSGSWLDDPERSANAGWIVGFVIIAGVCVVGAGLWFTYHP